MEDSDQDVQEINPPVINQTRRKNCHQRVLIEPLNAYFCRRIKRNVANQPIIDIENDNTPALSDLATSSMIEDVGIK
jgi:hypothetical protein